jgi:hypothetical protein
MPTQGDTPTAKFAALSDDRIVIQSQHLLRTSDADPETIGMWDQSDSTYPSGGDLDPSTADDSSAVNSRVRLYDGSINGGFSPDLTAGAVDDLYLWGDIDSSNQASVDFVVLFYDFTAISFEVAIRIELTGYQDDGDMTGNLQSRTIATTDPRTGFCPLWLPRQYDDVGGYLLKLEPTGAGSFSTSNLPTIRELMFGVWRQMGVQPLRPFSLDDLETETIQFFAESGYASHQVLHRGRWEQDATFILPVGDDTYGIDNVATARAIGADSSQLTEPIVVFPEPSTTPLRGHLIQTVEPGLRIPEVGRGRREWATRWREIAPFYAIRAGQ